MHAFLLAVVAAFGIAGVASLALDSDPGAPDNA